MCSMLDGCGARGSRLECGVGNFRALAPGRSIADQGIGLLIFGL